MTTQEIADKLVGYCRKGEFETAQLELYAQDATSLEPYATENFPKEVKGLDKIIEKGRKFEEMTGDTHSVEVQEPVITGNVIAFVLAMDITMKGKERGKWEELCVYTVKDGKIASEQFFM